jgi:hypothetical protein
MVSDIPYKPPCEQWWDGGNFSDGGPNVNVPSIPFKPSRRSVRPVMTHVGKNSMVHLLKFVHNIAFIYILNAAKLP